MHREALKIHQDARIFHRDARIFQKDARIFHRDASIFCRDARRIVLQRFALFFSCFESKNRPEKSKKGEEPTLPTLYLHF